MSVPHAQPSFLRYFRWPLAIILSFVIFALASAPGLIADGRTADDWRQVHGAPKGGMPLNWTTEEGRWLMEVIFVHVLREQFWPLLQTISGGLVLFVVAARIAREAVADTIQPFATFTLFVLGAHHIYMVNMLNFSSHVFAYPFALLLSLIAFDLFARATRVRLGLRVLMVLFGAQAIAFSAAIYQPFAPFGAILLFIAFMRIDHVTNADLLHRTVISTLGTLLGGALYAVQTRLAASLYPGEAIVERVNVASPGVLIDKLVNLPIDALRVWAGTLQFIPTWMKLANGAGYALAAVLVLIFLISIPGHNGSRWLARSRVLIGAAGLALLLPLFVWLANSSFYFPARVIAFIGFVWGALYFTAATRISDGSRFKPVLMAVPVAFALFQAGVASAVWKDQTETGQRDEALARDIYERVQAIPGYSGGPFRIVGGLEYADLSWGDFLGHTSFHPGNPKIGIFKDMFDLDWYAEGGLFDAPLSCSGLPAENATYLHDRTVYVCLSDVAGFETTSHCANSANDEVGRVCITETAVVRFRDACDLPPQASQTVFVDPEHGTEAIFENVEILGHATSGGCFYTAGWQGPLPRTTTVTILDAKDEPLWQEELTFE